jgi:hypothetical protein
LLNAPINSSVRPSLKCSLSGSPLVLAKGITATEATEGRAASLGPTVRLARGAPGCGASSPDTATASASARTTSRALRAAPPALSPGSASRAPPVARGGWAARRRSAGALGQVCGDEGMRGALAGERVASDQHLVRDDAPRVQVGSVIRLRVARRLPRAPCRPAYRARRRAG